MEFLKVVRRRSFLSEIAYIVLNIALVVSIVLLIRLTESPWLAIGLVLLSKWRVLAVRPRYWFINLQSNLVDYLVSISFVVFLYSAYSGPIIDSQKSLLIAILMIVYVVWLLFIRPHSKRLFVMIQAGVALSFGMGVLYSLAYAIPLSLLVILTWLVGYVTARHVLVHYNDEKHVVLLAQVWGLFIAEIGWLAYHWTVAYSLFGSTVVIPRVALTMLVLGFVAVKSYDSYYRHKRIRGNDIILPILFAFGVIVVLPILLNLLGVSVAIGV